MFAAAPLARRGTGGSRAQAQAGKPGQYTRLVRPRRKALTKRAVRWTDDVDELLELARRLEGRTLSTVTGRAFRVGVYRDCPFFTPESSGNGQSDGRKAAEAFVARFNDGGSLRPGDYADITRNASYFIGMLLAEPTEAER